MKKWHITLAANKTAMGQWREREAQLRLLLCPFPVKGVRLPLPTGIAMFASKGEGQKP